MGWRAKVEQAVPLPLSPRANPLEAHTLFMLWDGVYRGNLLQLHYFIRIETRSIVKALVKPFVKTPLLYCSKSLTATVGNSV